MKSRPIRERFNEKWTPDENGCWIWTSARTPTGYGSIWVGSNARAHRVSWELHRGPIPVGLHVLHRCDVPLCVRPEHLFLGTHNENMADMVAKGRYVVMRGATNGMAKLTADDVRAIRRRWPGETYLALGRAFGVTKATVGSIIRGRTWTHVLD